MGRDSCLVRVTAGAAIGGSIGGAVGAWIVEDKAHWANHSWKCSSFWTLHGSWELDTLWKIVLTSIVA
ncbi:hypothetical protein ZIOFF_034918 [Zingiber officinale]|uniref:Uncharacterized protein n=1 Tax=Zingiber officinale TaxID=94328 RepID=A0A8J5L2A3_ZINOF|nr:hypothetical protein ZIOFF_034918 [Zingiber officinale]